MLNRVRKQSPNAAKLGTLALLTVGLGFASAAGSAGPDPANPPPLQVTATPGDFFEGTIDKVVLQSRFEGMPSSYSWSQVSGPRVPLTVYGARFAIAHVEELEVAVDVELTFEFQVVVQGRHLSENRTVRVRPVDMAPVLQPNVQVGGATTAVASFEVEGTPWALFNVGGRLSATRVSTEPGAVYSIQSQGFVQDALVVPRGEALYALLASGREGIAIVDVTDPTAMVWLGNVRLNYEQTGLTWTEGGGAILVDQVISGTKGQVEALETDGTTLWIANGSYGIHRTALENLLGPEGPVLEPDGTLLVEHEAYILQYAGELPWGAPLALQLVGDKLFVAQQFVGLTVYDASSLDRVGAYNLYTDVGCAEDWFVDMDVSQEVQPGFLDAVTGMPDYRQASFEIENSHGSGGAGQPFPTPWADFDKYGKYYYQAQDLDVVVSSEGAIAYVAYGLGGLVAVDVTGFQDASPGAGFLEGTYLGYAPAVPAHGSDEFIGDHNESLFPHFGAGMLKEAGVVDVTVVGNYAYFTDHFAGLAVIAGAHDPAVRWRGAAAPYDNDDEVPGDHNPDYEFVTSYDMSPYDPEDHESLPTWMYERPSLMVTGEIGGHGNSLMLLPEMVVEEAGQVDALVCLGAGGLAFVDIVGFREPEPLDRFEVVGYFPTTDEVGAAPDGTPTATISIGHSQGADASDRYLYLADGPHGVSAWSLLDADGYPTDDVHLVANTVQDEYPVEVGGEVVYPATHAYGIVYEPEGRSALTLCQGVGLRRVPVADVESGGGQVGSPLLVAPAAHDIFEHNGAWGKIHETPKQDHAYDVAYEDGLAYVADGGNGLTVYDLTKDPTDLESGFFVGNLGGQTQERPPLGRATGIALWHHPVTDFRYAFVSAGPYGVGVANVSDPSEPFLVKVFEPVKLEDGKVGKADGRCVDVFVMGDYAYFTYDGFGVLCYAIVDLIAPLPDGVPPTKIWKVQGGVTLYDHRPLTQAEFRLREEPGYEDWGGGALNMQHTEVAGEPVLYVAYGVAGIVKLNWIDPAHPVLLDVVPTVGECSAIALSNGRLYAADGSGGLVFFK